MLSYKKKSCRIFSFFQANATISMYFKLLTNDFLFQDGISGWLCEEMSRDGLEMDQMDMSGNTPLHLAARSGNTKTASTLLNLGASVNMKVAFHDQEISLKLF